MSVLNKVVSYFPSMKNTTNGVDASLLVLLQSNKHEVIIQSLRASDEVTQKIIKESLPCYTVAGRFSMRSKAGLLELSGLANADLDSAEDYDIISLLQELKKIKSIAYAGLSCRGQRLHCIIPFLYPDKYEKHYERLIQSFDDMGLPMGDNCHKQFSQPRFVSFNDDTTQFFNHNAQPYNLLPPEKTVHIIHRKPFQALPSSIPDNAFQWCNDQINKSHAFTLGNRHEYILQLARYCNIKGVAPQESLNGCLSYVQSDFSNKEITKIVKHIYTSHTDSFNKLPYIEKKSKLIIEKQVEPVVIKPARKLIKTSFLGKDGKFYIPNPVEPSRIAVYNNPEAYNKRLHIPSYIDKVIADKMFLRALPVDLSLLQTIDK